MASPAEVDQMAPSSGQSEDITDGAPQNFNYCIFSQLLYVNVHDRQLFSEWYCVCACV